MSIIFRSPITPSSSIRFIESVTDFTGRSVTYEYYQNGDAHGAFGDLRSVTSPPVTGVPTGNDFPQGKTTVYRYNTGFNDRMVSRNHVGPSGIRQLKDKVGSNHAG